MRYLYFVLRPVFLILFILLLQYAIKFFIYAVDYKVYHYYLYSKIAPKNGQGLEQLVRDYPIIIYRISLFGLIWFLFICGLTLSLFRKRIASAIIAIVVAGTLIYFDTLKMWSPKFFITLPQSWFSDFRTHLIATGLICLGFSFGLYLIADKYLDKIGYRHNKGRLAS
jgi:hypothetical protein